MMKSLFTRIGAVLLAATVLYAAEPFETESSEPAQHTSPSEDYFPRPLRRTPYSKPQHFTSQTLGEESPGMIPGLDQELTQHYIRRYSSPGHFAWIREAMVRSAPYLTFIRKEIEERNLPPELLYLPVIESAYMPTAMSKSGAAGLWQFMRNSISPYDMKINEWMDERMDFWKSTIGALGKLEENYRQLGDWPLALAAYNSGLGGVSRIVQQTGVKDYWALSEKKQFKVETIHYVPKLLAVSYVLSNPRRFGIDPLWLESVEWARVKVDRTINLDLLANEAGINKDELKKANRELYFNVTPPNQEYYLKVRASDAATVSAVLERKDLSLIKYYFHTIKSGDTLSALALHYGVSVDTILNANPSLQAKYLKIGATVMIPAFKTVEPYQAPARVAQQYSGPAPHFTGSHTVQRGETLWSIARSYQIKPETLAEANGMGLNDTLREGRILKTPIR